MNISDKAEFAGTAMCICLLHTKGCPFHTLLWLKYTLWNSHIDFVCYFTQSVFWVCRCPIVVWFPSICQKVISRKRLPGDAAWALVWKIKSNSPCLTEMVKTRKGAFATFLCSNKYTIEAIMFADFMYNLTFSKIHLQH